MEKTGEGLSLPFLVASIFLNIVSADCPDRCTCLGSTVDCTGLGLDKIPSGIPDTAQNLFLRGFRLQTLKRDVFPSLPLLTFLDLSNCSINDIYPGAFLNLPKLRHLDLTTNVLERLHTSVFEGLQLFGLFLSHNKPLREISPFAFRGLNVSRLYLNGCNIRQPDLLWLQPIRHTLSHLDLSHNPLGLILPGALQNIALEELHLKNCSIIDVSSLLADTVRVEKLDVSKNNLGNIQLSSVFGVSGLTHLVARETDAEILELNGSSMTLIHLDISFNRIFVIAGFMFSRMPKLETLIWKKNNVERLINDFWDYFNNIQLIDLGENKIRDMEQLFLGKVKSLKTLDLSENQIATVPERIKDYPETIKRILLGGNPLHCNCEMLWLRQSALQSGGMTIENANCASPKPGKLTALEPTAFVCAIPAIQSFLVERSFGNRDNALITCVAEGDPAPTVTVQQSGGRGRWWRSSPSGDSVVNSISNVLNASRCGDIGVYTCIAENIEGAVNATVLIPPTSGVSCDNFNFTLTATSQGSTEQSRTSAPGVSDVTSRPSVSSEKIPYISTSIDLTYTVPSSEQNKTETMSLLNRTDTSLITMLRKTTMSTKVTTSEFRSGGMTSESPRQQSTQGSEVTTQDVGTYASSNRNCVSNSCGQSSGGSGYILGIVFGTIGVLFLIFIIVVVSVKCYCKRGGYNTNQVVPETTRENYTHRAERNGHAAQTG